MSCFFPACDYVAGRAVSRNITLHRFPEEEPLRTLWLEVLGKVGWDLDADSGVCSKHFLPEDFLMTRSGRKLRSDAVPINVQVCRICFARNCQLYPLKDEKQLDLSKPSYALAYETLTGLSIGEDDKLPPYLCVQCANRLLKCVRFRARCIRAHTILTDIINDNGYVSLDTILAVNRFHKPVSTYEIEVETASEYINSDNVCPGEQGLTQEHFTYRIKSESIDIVDHDIKDRYIKSTDKRQSSNIEDSSTINVKAEVEEFGTFDDLESPNINACNIDAAESNDVDQNITSKELSKTNVDIPINKVSINGESHNTYTESKKHKTNKDLNFNSNSIEDVFTGEKCSQNGFVSSGELNQKEKHNPSTVKESMTIGNNLDQTISKKKRKLGGNGGLLLSYKLLSCDICNYQTINKVQLMNHLKCHSVAKVYNCKTCYFLTNSKTSLQFHTEVHGNKKHICNICKKIFAFRHDLRAHLRIHSGEKPYACNVCDKKFVQYNQLLVHSRIHTGEKPYSCNICSKTFRQKGQLQNHSRLHSGEKPYSCNVCNKAFIQRGQLQNHLLKHTNETKYSCDTCGKSFSIKGRLQNHMRVHAK